MKKFITLLALVCAAMVIVPNANAQKMQKQKPNKVVKYAQKKPETRAWGEGTHFNESTARNIAEMQARAALSAKIESGVYQMLEEAVTDKTQYVSNGNTAAALAESTTERKTQTSAITSQVLRNTPVVKTEIYYQDNKQYKVYVCVEFQGSIDDLYNKFAENIANIKTSNGEPRYEIHQEEARKVFTATLKQ
jgi:hypothetical protein